MARPVSPHTLITKPITIFLFYYSLLISSQTSLTTSLEISITLPPISLPDLLSFADQRLALVFPIIQAFKNTITNDPLGITKTWTGSDICSYAGFYCGATPENASGTAVASVDFNGFGLSAPTLSGFLDGLPDLAVFHANSNNFSGTISPSIAALKHLFELDISSNNFIGPFPISSVESAESLTFLDVRFNSFTGSIPDQLFNLEALEFLFLNNNAFSLILPKTLGSSRAKYINLANNLFSGPIPRSIGSASKTLVELMIRGNKLSGCLPYELGLLKNAVLFDAEDNLLTGPIPISLQCMDSIEVLNLAGNRLFGAVPEAVCLLGGLANLSLSGNYFSSVGPACRRLIGAGILDVRKNCIPGLPGQRSSSECSLFVPLSCANPSWFNLVPCGQKFKKKAKSPQAQPRPHRKLVSYAALSGRRLAL